MSSAASSRLVQIRAVVFDLDGTLIDSRRDLASAVNALREELGLAPLSLERVVSMVGWGARVLVERALRDRAAGGEPADAEGSIDVDRAFERFLDLYDRRCLDTTMPYAGVPEMLGALAGRYPMAVLTNKPERSTRKILGAQSGLFHALAGQGARFQAVVGGDTLRTRKPDPEGLRWIARRLGVPVGHVLFVGDSAVDGETARAADVPLALVRWGFGTEEELAPFEPLLRPAKPDELAEVLG